VPDPDVPARAVPDRASAASAPADRPAPDPTARRLPTALAAAVVVLAGLATASVGAGPWADALGDALYAALVLLLRRLLLPRLRTTMLAVTALLLCTAIEAAQATGVPAAVVRAFPPARYVLGTTFVATDLLAYAAGVLVTAGALLLAGRGRSSDRAPHGGGGPHRGG
jgi:hypothetical protein